MNTSYFNKCKFLIDNGYTNLISISGKTLPYFINQIKNGDNRFREYKKLAPNIDKYYETVLNNLNPNEVINELGNDAILLCYEAPNKFCHRHIVAKWIKENTNIDVNELKF